MLRYLSMVGSNSKMALFVCIALLALIVSIFYSYCKIKFSYWSEKGVKGPTPWPVAGNFGNVMLQKESFHQRVKEIYLKYKQEQLVGLFRGFQPVILVRDPELVKHVLIKHFNVFQDRGISSNGSRLNDKLFGSESGKWRVMRPKITSLFTTRKLKNMIPKIQQCIDSFIQYVEKLIDANIDHEIRALTVKYALDVIGLCAFGLELNTFTDEKNEFSIVAEKISTPSIKLRILTVLDMIIPGIRRKFNTSYEIHEFFVNLLRKVRIEREGKPLNNSDFMDLMIELKRQGTAKSKLDNGVSEIEIDDYMIATQALNFLSPGFETPPAAMSFLIHELALNQDIQDRVYKEICQVLDKYNNELCYDAIIDMKYLKMVFDETNRKHSLATVLCRTSNSDYTFPGTNVTIGKGTPVVISASGMNADPKYFPNPDKFDPENFSDEKFSSLPQCVYLPFGDGPRNCIGMRFAKVQSMMGIAAFLKKFKVGPSAKTKQELEVDPKAIVLSAKGGLWVNISIR